jgi:hypothetical protein
MPLTMRFRLSLLIAYHFIDADLITSSTMIDLMVTIIIWQGITKLLIIGEPY